MAQEALGCTGGAADDTQQMRADLVAVAGCFMAGDAAVEDVLALHGVAAGMSSNGGWQEKKAAAEETARSMADPGEFWLTAFYRTEALNKRCIVADWQRAQPNFLRPDDGSQACCARSRRRKSCSRSTAGVVDAGLRRMPISRSGSTGSPSLPPTMRSDGGTLR